MKHPKFDRRKFLQSSSVVLSLPFLESLFWREARAQAVRPLKLAFLMFPMGTHVDMSNNCLGEGGRSWLIPDVVGGKLDFSRREALKPLDTFKNDLIFPLRFYIRDDNMNDAPHIGAGQFLTVAGFANQPNYPENYDRNLRSIDHDIGTALGLKRTTLEHLNIVSADTFNIKAGIDGFETNSKANVYASWKGVNVNGQQDLLAADEQVEHNPLELFNKLFPNNMGSGTTAEQIKVRRKRSILDSLVPDLASLRLQLSGEDKLQLDRYTASVRDLEGSLTDVPGPVCNPPATNTFKNSGGFDNNASAFQTFTKQMMEVIALGFACDRVRLVTYVLDSMIYGRQFSLIYPIEFHATTHLDGSFGTSDQTTDMRWREYRAYNKLYTSLFAYLLQLLKDNGSLDSSLLVLGSGMNMFRSPDGNASNHHSEDLPIILAGKANGLVTPGRVVDLGKKVRLGTLWQEIYQLSTGSDIDLGSSMGAYYKKPGSNIFSRSDNINIPLKV